MRPTTDGPVRKLACQMIRQSIGSHGTSGGVAPSNNSLKPNSAGVRIGCRRVPAAEGYRQVDLPPSAESAWGLSWSPAGATVCVALPASAERLSSRPLGGILAPSVLSPPS